MYFTLLCLEICNCRGVCLGFLLNAYHNVGDNMLWVLKVLVNSCRATVGCHRRLNRRFARGKHCSATLYVSCTQTLSQPMTPDPFTIFKVLVILLEDQLHTSIWKPVAFCHAFLSKPPDCDTSVVTTDELRHGSLKGKVILLH